MDLEWLSAFRLRCGALLARRRLRRDLEDELQFHLDTMAVHHREAGTEAGEAERLSRLKFGNPTSFEEVCRDMWTFHWIEVMLQDIRYVTRTLAKSPAFAAATVLTLALGIGASTAIFSVVNAVLLRPLPFRNPGQIYRIRTISAQGLPTGLVGPRHMVPLEKDHPSIEAAALGFSFESSLVTRDGTAIPLNDHRVSEEFFNIFDNPMTMGRNFKPEESFDRTVLSYPVWRDVFHSDPNILGKVIAVSGGPLTVVGVAAPGFDFPDRTQIWTKMFLPPAANILTNMEGFVRLRPGYTQAQLEAELARLAPNVQREPDNHPVKFVVRHLLADVVGDLRPTVLILSGAMAILLLIACLNVANLLFARGATRTREIAVRGALGAGRWRVVGQLMTESLVLCFVGGCLGLGVATALIRLLPSVAPANMPRLDTVSLDHTVFLFAAGCILFTAVLVGLAPALRITRGNLIGQIQEGGRSSSASPRQNRIFGALVIAEIAMAIMLVIGAGLLVRSYMQLTSTNPGFQPNGLLTLTITPQGRIDYRPVLDANGKPIPDGHGFIQLTGTGYLPLARFYQQLIGRVEALPGVVSAAATSSAPLHPEQLGWDAPNPYSIAGEPATDTLPAGRRASAHRVTLEYFKTMGIHLMSGRLLNAADARNSRGVAVVDQAFVRAFFPGQNPIGHSLILPEPAAWKPTGLAFVLGDRSVDQAEIVGVVSDVKHDSLSEPAAPSIYIPHEQWTVRRMVVVIRSTSSNPASLIPAVRSELRKMDPTIPAKFDVYSDAIAGSISRQRLATLLLAAFASLALILAAVGIYGLMSYSVTHQSREIAVRAAMGASPAELLGLILRRGLQLAVAGIILGVAGAVALRQVIASQLYEVSTLDLRVFMAVPLVLLAVALLSSCLPARRAAKIDPAAMLRIT